MVASDWSLKDQDLLPEGEIFQQEVAVGTQKVPHGGQDEVKHSVGIGHLDM